MQPILECDSLTKRYGTVNAVSALNLHVQPGEIVGLLGPNGSGKSTALRMVLGFLKPTSGTARVGGFDCWAQSVEVRKRIAYLPGELRLYENMTGRQLVQFLGKLRKEPPGAEVDRLAKRLDIDPDQPLVQMSSGMKRKVALLAILVPKVPLMILDEPTNTLDPTMRDELLAQLALARSEGKAVLFSSHVLQEVEAIGDRVIILRKGERVHEQPLAELRDARLVKATLAGPAPRRDPHGEPMTVVGSELSLEYRGPLPKLLAWLADQPLANLTVAPLGLEAIYRKFHGTPSPE